MHLLRYLTLFALCSLMLSACSNSNTVITLQNDPPYATQRDGRYINSYRGDDVSYPQVCEESCYEEHPWLRCDEPGERCTYTGPTLTDLPQTGFTVRWLGHASFKVQTPDGLTILLDPVSGQFDWPVNWAFRLSAGFNREPGEWLSDDAKQGIDAILYSHLHYDHFSKGDIRRLGSDPDYFVFSGMASHLPNGGHTIYEMDWYTQVELGDTRIHAVPAHHFNSRIWVPFIYDDSNRALWGAWLLESNGKTLFFAGDTGYSPHFTDIHQRFGDIDICLIPIASYHHEEHGDWYRYVHTKPEDALVAANDLQCKLMIPWGYGNASWQMGDHSSHSALIRLLNLDAEQHTMPPLLILNEGDSVQL